MGDAFHTFHIHGHRWVVPGPAGTKHADIEQSAQVQATSQFEDTKVFGPASSFAFTLEEGNGMLRADPPIGEWHMHCHVGHHMMEGMVGSVLIVNGGELALPLPIGKACPTQSEPEAPKTEGPPPKTYDVSITGAMPPYDHFKDWDIYIAPGDTVRWTNVDRQPHNVASDDNAWGSGTLQPGQQYSRVFTKQGLVTYHCDFHRYQGNWQIGGILRVIPPAGGGAPVSPPPATPTTHQVQITSTGFSPSTISIKAGDAINWTNQDLSAHTATADDHSWTTPILTSGKSFSRTFTSAGTVGYHCHIHHEMTATAQVNP